MGQSSIHEDSNQGRKQVKGQGKIRSRGQSREKDTSQDRGQVMVQNNSGASGQDNSQNTGQSKKGRGGKPKKRKDNSSILPTSKDSWKWNTEIDSTTLSPLPTFVGNLPGPKGEAIGVRSQLECFQLFLSSEVYDELLTQSNLYAEQQRAAKNDNTP